jgi:hypothetical protein
MDWTFWEAFGAVVTCKNTSSVLLTFVRDGSVEGFFTEVALCVGTPTLYQQSRLAWAYGLHCQKFWEQVMTL